MTLWHRADQVELFRQGDRCCDCERLRFFDLRRGALQVSDATNPSVGDSIPKLDGEEDQFAGSLKAPVAGHHDAFPGRHRSRRIASLHPPYGLAC